MKHRRFHCLLLLLALPLLTGLAAGCRQESSQAQPADAASEPVKVQAAPVQLQNWPKVVRVQGSLLADENVVVGAKVAGRVKQVRVDLGTVVRQGDVLITLDNEELDLKVKQAEAQLQQARAKLGLKPDEKEEAIDPANQPTVLQEKALWDQAKDNLQRGESLAEERAIAKEELEQRQAILAVAKAKYFAAVNDVKEQAALIGVRRAELALAKQILADGEARAPFDGIIEERHVAPGAYLQAGESVVSMVRVHPLRFRGGVPEREALQLRTQQDARITVEGLGEPIRARVSRVSPSLDMANRSLLVEADVPNPDFRLRVGLFSEAEILVDPDSKALAVPASAVREFAGVEKVWVVRNGEATEQIVQTGRRQESRIEILKGLSPGDVVIANAQTARRGPVIVSD